MAGHEGCADGAMCVLAFRTSGTMFSDRAAAVITLTAMDGFKSWSMAAASARRLDGHTGEATPPCRRFKLPSELGVRMPERGRDASPSRSPSTRAEEDIGADGSSFGGRHCWPGRVCWFWQRLARGGCGCGVWLSVTINSGFWWLNVLRYQHC